MKNTISQASAARAGAAANLRELEEAYVTLEAGALNVSLALSELIRATNRLRRAGTKQDVDAAGSRMLGELTGYAASSAITWAALTSRGGEGFLSRTVAATAALRTILESYRIELARLEDHTRPDGRDLERDWTKKA